MSRRRPRTAFVAFRADEATAERLDALAAKLSNNVHDVNRSEVARAAIALGLEQLEAQTFSRQGADE